MPPQLKNFTRKPTHSVQLLNPSQPPPCLIWDCDYCIVTLIYVFGPFPLPRRSAQYLGGSGSRADCQYALRDDHAKPEFKIYCRTRHSRDLWYNFRGLDWRYSAGSPVPLTIFIFISSSSRWLILLLRENFDSNNHVRFRALPITTSKR